MGGAGALLAPGHRAMAQAGPVEPMAGEAKLVDRAVADCDAIKRLDNNFRQEAARSATMPSAETDAEVGAIVAALNKRKTVADATQAALAAGKLDLALTAADSILDLVVAACLPEQNQLCIASAYGVKLVGGAAGSAVQLYKTKNGTEQAKVGIAFAKSRMALFRQMANDLKPRPVHDAALKTVERVVKIGVRLAKSGAKVLEAKADFDAAVAALAEMELGYGWTLTNEANYRVFRRQHFEAQRWLPQILLMAYPVTCRTDSVPLPLP